MKRSCLLPASVIALLLISSVAWAFEGPLQVRNRFPLFLHADAPYLESASTGSSFSAGLSHASVFMQKTSPDWSVNLDLEVSELILRYRKEIPDLFELGIEIPLLSFNSGFMDSMLNSYHNTFGFPDYGRSSRPENSFLYELRKNGALIIKGRGGDIGIGDIRISAKKKLLLDDPVVGVKAEIEIPTGDAKKGFGNGSADAGLSLLIDKRLSERIMSYLNIGLVIPGGLKAEQKIRLREFLHASAGIEAALWKDFSLLGQITLQGSPFPKTEIGSLDRPAVLLTLGGRYTPGRHGIEFSLTEDPNTAGAPDVAFNLAYTIKLK
ncbi:MAG: DUF3187 family protein [Nitrospirae bacterium]|nr:DUF3187 family protein [Nitrospirota bacterium]